MTYTSSTQLIQALKQFEGCRLKAYKPVPTEKYWTIGFGHYGPEIKQGQVISENDAIALLRGDLKKFEDYVNGLNVCKTQGQFDALVDFAYNCGIGNLSKSTLLKYIKEKKSTANIQAQFMLWNKAGGKVLAGLTKRRQWEAQRWAN